MPNSTINKGSNRTLTKRGYIFSENEYLEKLVHQISRGGTAKNDFRRIYEVNAMVFIENKFRTMIVSNKTKAVKTQYWSANTQRMAQVITEKLLKEIEKGKFDVYDEQGQIRTKDDGSPKIRNLGGAIWEKMRYIFIDLINSNIEPYRDSFDEDIPFEKKYIEFLDEAMAAQDDPLIKQKIETIKKKQKKKLKKIKTANQFIHWIKESADNIPNSPLDLLIKKYESENSSKIIKNCFKQLTQTQKKYTAFAALGFMKKDIADIFGVKPSAVTQTMKKALPRLHSCIEEAGMDTVMDRLGGSDGA
jgi:hypothetical protein